MVSTRSPTRALQGKRIGVVQGSPGGNYVAKYGLMGNIKGYPMMVDRRYFNPAEEMMNDIRSGEIAAGVQWGPMAAYWAARDGEKLVVVPLLKETGCRQNCVPRNDGRSPRRRCLEAALE